MFTPSFSNKISLSEVRINQRYKTKSIGRKGEAEPFDMNGRKWDTDQKLGGAICITCLKLVAISAPISLMH